jgi:oligopeptidase A
MDNPLLSTTTLPAFSSIRPEHVEPAVDALLRDARAQIDELLAGDRHSWSSLIEPLTAMENRIERAWNPVSHLNGVMNSRELREAYDRCLQKLTQFYTERGQNRQLFEAYRASTRTARTSRRSSARCWRTPCATSASPASTCPPTEGPLAEISEELSRCPAISRQASSTPRTLEQAHRGSRRAGGPATASALDLARQTATQRGLDGYLLTLDIPSYLPVMTYAEDAALREEVYRAFSTRASDEGPRPASSTTRQHGADPRPAPRAGAAARLRPTTPSVTGDQDGALHRRGAGLSGGSRRALETQAERELRGARAAFAREHGHETLQPWDIAYYSEKLRQHRTHHGGRGQTLLPVNRVIPACSRWSAGCSACASTAATTSTATTRTCCSTRSAMPDGEPARPVLLRPLRAQNKRGGAWMAVASRAWCRRREPDTRRLHDLQLHAAGRRPAALLTHREVETLFHEFGHGLHHMLTRVDYPAISGINGVAWDAVELPSQFMENYCWEREALDLFARHHETGEAMPEVLYERMMRRRTSSPAMMMVRQLEFALFDFRMHREYDPAPADASTTSSRRCASRSPWSARRPGTASPTPFQHISSAAATRRATTATSGRRCCPPMRSRCSRNAASSTRTRAAPS